MNFMTKKILSALILPVPIIVVLLIIGTLLLYFHQYTKVTKIIFTLATLVMLTFTTSFVPSLMLKHLESQYLPLTHIPANVNKIVVLGAGNGGYLQYPPNSRLSAASLARLVEGIRLYKTSPGSQLILSGGRVFGSPADSAVMNNVASMLGVKISDIVLESGSRDTYHEALNLKKILRNQPFLLVTSAYHMPRAMALFRHQGMKPIAAPTELLLGSKRYSAKYYLPNSVNLVYSDIAIHEYLGLLWEKLTEKI